MSFLVAGIGVDDILKRFVVGTCFRGSIVEHVELFGVLLLFCRSWECWVLSVLRALPFVCLQSAQVTQLRLDENSQNTLEQRMSLCIA